MSSRFWLFRNDSSIEQGYNRQPYYTMPMQIVLCSFINQQTRMAEQKKHNIMSYEEGKICNNNT